MISCRVVNFYNSHQTTKKNNESKQINKSFRLYSLSSDSVTMTHFTHYVTLSDTGMKYHIYLGIFPKIKVINILGRIIVSGKIWKC